MSRTSRNNKQKGRKHRRVNRTPRPVTPVGRRTGRTAHEPAAERPVVDAARSSTDAERIPAVVKQIPGDAQQPPAGTGRTPAAAGHAPAEGLSRHAQRTLTCLYDSGSHGATTDDLSGAVGFTARTVAKHLDGLSRCGLVEQRADGRWSATDPGPGPAAREPSLPAQGRGAKEAVMSTR